MDRQPFAALVAETAISPDAWKPLMPAVRNSAIPACVRTSRPRSRGRIAPALKRG